MLQDSSLREMDRERGGGGVCVGLVGGRGCVEGKNISAPRRVEKVPLKSVEKSVKGGCKVCARNSLRQLEAA